ISAEHGDRTKDSEARGRVRLPPIEGDALALGLSRRVCETGVRPYRRVLRQRDRVVRPRPVDHGARRVDDTPPACGTQQGARAFDTGDAVVLDVHDDIGAGCASGHARARILQATDDSAAQRSLRTDDRYVQHRTYHALMAEEGPSGNPFEQLPIFGD